MKKIFLCVPLLIVSLFFLPHEKEEFSLETIHAELPFHEEWEGRPLNCDERQEVEVALSQPYSYLGSGGQCYSFASQDGKYVIKFFKQKKFAISSWTQQLPMSDWLFQKKSIKKEEKRNRVFSAFQLSFNHLFDETGLLYIHLNPTHHLKKILSLQDAQGNAHLLNLDELEFIVQRKAELAYQTLDSLVANAKGEKIKQAIDQLLALNISLAKKGFRNRDPSFRSNYGFIDSDGQMQAILIDVGRVVCEKERKVTKIELLESTSSLRKYLSAQHPHLLKDLDQSIDKRLSLIDSDIP